MYIHVHAQNLHIQVHMHYKVGDMGVWTSVKTWGYGPLSSLYQIHAYIMHMIV